MAMLKRLFEPLIQANARLYSRLNEVSLQFLKSRDKKIPTFVTANNITTIRTFFLVPTLFAYSNGYHFMPAVLVMMNLTGDYFDGAVARWEQEQVKGRSTKPGYVEEISSARVIRLQNTFGAYYDAVADKAFAIPVWLCIFQHSGADGSSLLQIGVLCLVAIESYSTFIRTRSFYVEPSPLDKESLVQGRMPCNKSSSQDLIKATSTGKAKQTLAMIGTALSMIPMLEPVGTLLIWTSVPLALGSVMEKLKVRTVYCEVEGVVTSNMLQFLEQAKGLGSRLIVGIRCSDPQESNELLRMMRLIYSVDSVVPPSSLPPCIDKAFLERHKIKIIAVKGEETYEDQSKRYDPALYSSGNIIPVTGTVSR